MTRNAPVLNPGARPRSTITATLPGAPLAAFSDRSPAVIAPTALSMVRLTCGTTSPCVAHSTARSIPRSRKPRPSLSNVATALASPVESTPAV